MQDLRIKIEQRMEILQAWMEVDYHMRNPEVVYAHTLTISKFWSVLSEEDKEYIQCAQNAIDEKSTITWRPNGDTTKK
jgi:hypothetical protein|tara:strand:+ start:7303 stop:7536 length:234 start_codon:yes stop_codon:yes gene_type:complete